MFTPAKDGPCLRGEWKNCQPEEVDQGDHRGGPAEAAECGNQSAGQVWTDRSDDPARVVTESGPSRP